MSLLAAGICQHVSEFLGEAEEAYRHRLYASTVVMSRAAVRYRLSGGLKREGSSLRDLAARAKRDGADIDVSEIGKLSWIRNKAIHEGYVPRREEASWAVRTAGRNIEGLEKRGLLHRAMRWLSP